LPLSAFKVENCVPKEERSAISTPSRDFFPSPRLPRARYTAIISLRPDKELKEIFDDGCQLKLYLARLITRPSYAHSATFIVHLGLFVSYSVSFVSNSPCSVGEHHSPLLQALNKFCSDTRTTELLCCFPHLPAADAVLSMARVVRVLA
jgi:hypothetical protein